MVPRANQSAVDAMRRWGRKGEKIGEGRDETTTRTAAVSFTNPTYTATTCTITSNPGNDN